MKQKLCFIFLFFVTQIYTATDEASHRTVTSPVLSWISNGTTAVGTLDNLVANNSISCAGTLSVTGSTTLDTLATTGLATFSASPSSLSVTTTETVSGTLSTSTAATFSTLSITGNQTVGGTLSVALASTLASINGTNLSLSSTESVGGNVNWSTSTIVWKPTGTFINTIGTNNTFFGVNAGTLTLTPASAVNNTGIGDSALASLTTGSNNTAVGYIAGNALTTGSYNVAVGAGALQVYALTVSNNVAVGYQAQSEGNGSNNTSVGYEALFPVSQGTGSNNIAIGYQAGGTLTSGGSNIYIGASAASSTESNTIRIGTQGTGAGEQNVCYIAGISGATSSGGVEVFVSSTGQLGTTTSSRRFKENIAPITNETTRKFLQLEPVTFIYKEDSERRQQYGFVAEDVEPFLPELVVYDAHNQPFSIRYHCMHALLLKLIQENRRLIQETEQKYTKHNELISQLIAQIAKLTD
jgi:trimeric autotransporter adhesin